MILILKMKIIRTAMKKQKMKKVKKVKGMKYFNRKPEKKTHLSYLKFNFN